MRRFIRTVSVLILATLILSGLPVRAADEHAFVGSKKCKMCHLKEHKSWGATKMANTFDSLKPGERAEAKTRVGLDPAKDYTKDPDCVRCHVTGYGKPGGFKDIASTPELAGVGCEECHGAGGTYLQDGYMTLKNKEYKKADLVAVGMVGEVTQAQCTHCHNSDSPFAGEGYKFDFATRKKEGTHEIFPLKYAH